MEIIAEEKERVNGLVSFHEFTVPAGGSIQRPAMGQQVYFENASATFDWQTDLSEKRLGRRTTRGRFGDRFFSYVTIFNRSAVKELKIAFTAGDKDSDITSGADQLPPVITVPYGVNLTVYGGSPGQAAFDAASALELPGYTPDTAAYTNLGLSPGSRRKELIIRCRASLAGLGDIDIYSKSNGIYGLVGYIAPTAAGGEFKLESDHDLMVYNRTSAVLVSSSIAAFTASNIAVMANFYA